MSERKTYENEKVRKLKRIILELDELCLKERYKITKFNMVENENGNFNLVVEFDKVDNENDVSRMLCYNNRTYLYSMTKARNYVILNNGIILNQYTHKTKKLNHILKNTVITIWKIKTKEDSKIIDEFESEIKELSNKENDIVNNIKVLKRELIEIRDEKQELEKKKKKMQKFISI